MSITSVADRVIRMLTANAAMVINVNYSDDRVWWVAEYRYRSDDRARYTGAHKTNDDALTNEGRLKKRRFFPRKLCTPGQWLMLRCASIKTDAVYLMALSVFRSDVGASRNSSKRGMTFLCLFVISLRIKTIRYFRLLHWIPHPILHRFDA
jgi:hypothetical protein